MIALDKVPSYRCSRLRISALATPRAVWRVKCSVVMNCRMCCRSAPAPDSSTITSVNPPGGGCRPEFRDAPAWRIMMGLGVTRRLVAEHDLARDAGPGRPRAGSYHNEAHLEVWLTWTCAQRLRAAYRHPNPVEGRRIAERVVETFPTCPVTEIARLGRTLRQWKTAFFVYFDTGRACNGGSEAINGLIELHRRIARGFPTATTTAYACC
jgi:hypothetical protein